MSQYKILCTDIDGTLLGNSNTVSNENMHAIAAMSEKGVQVVPTTGRSFDELPPQLRDDPHIRYYVLSNGTVVFDKQTGQRNGAFLSPEQIRRIVAVFDRHSVKVMTHAYGHSYANAHTDSDEDYTRFHMNGVWMDQIRTLNILLDHYRESILQMDEIEMFCAFAEHDVKKLRADMETLTDLHITSSEQHNIEFFDKKGGKENGIIRLASFLKTDISQLIAVGDNFNDIGMIRTAGLGLAVSNACPALKEAADRVICSMEEHAMAYIAANIIG